MQQTEQQHAQRVVGRPFVGSGNPTGQPARKRHAIELTAQFLRVHGRDPDIIEAGTIRNVAAMMARVNRVRGGISSDDLVRLSNAIARLVEKLGLDRKPEPPAPDPRQNLEAHCARINGGGDG